MRERCLQGVQQVDDYADELLNNRDEEKYERARKTWRRRRGGKGGLRQSRGLDGLRSYMREWDRFVKR